MIDERIMTNNVSPKNIHLRKGDRVFISNTNLVIIYSGEHSVKCQEIDFEDRFLRDYEAEYLVKAIELNSDEVVIE
jgi:hypothetical protein